MTFLPFAAAVEAYKQLIEDNESAMPMLVVEVKDAPPFIFGVQVTEDARPAGYVRAIGAELTGRGLTIERMTWQCESWSHIYDSQGNETGLGEACVVMMRDISGEEKRVIIPFTRTNDGVHWREPEYDDEGDQASGDLVEALREVVHA